MRAPRNTRTITAVEEYRGESTIRVAATQLGAGYSRAQVSKTLTDWIEFLSAGPTPIEDLQFVTRTPDRLFQALSGQTQLRRLSVKWGNYDDLSVLTEMGRLAVLELRGASSVRSLEPLSSLASVTDLAVESLRRVDDVTAVGSMSGVTRLELGGDWISSRRAHIRSIAFLRTMPQLRHLLIHTLIVDDLDYSPLLDLPQLETVRVMKAKGMRPSHDELRARLPWDC